MIMNEKTRILVVEDDMIIAANISLQLTNLGYEITGIETRGEEALAHVLLNAPDIILMDVNLRGDLDGIETARAIQKNIEVPIVYLTANTDDISFTRAKETHPYAFIPKPLNIQQLQRSLALVEEQVKEKMEAFKKDDIPVEVMDDRIFVRSKGKMTKLLFTDILYIEADRNYCKIVTSQGKHLLSVTLRIMEEKLPKHLFIRVHRSYMVNISKLDAVVEGHLEINRKVIPLGKSQKRFLLRRLQTI